MTQMRLDSAATARNDARAGAATPAPIGADEAIMRMLPQMDVQLGNEKEGGLRLNGTVGIVVMMGLLTLLPTLLLMMTGFAHAPLAHGAVIAPACQMLTGIGLSAWLAREPITRETAAGAACLGLGRGRRRRT